VIEGCALGQNYPNPFNAETTIFYDVPARTFVSLDVFDVLGREVGILANGIQDPGRESVNFNASTLSSGIHFYRFSSGKFSQAIKMVFAR
jgi:hypothetical protein